MKSRKPRSTKHRSQARDTNTKKDQTPIHSKLHFRRLEVDYGSWIPYVTTLVPVLVVTLKVLALAHWDYALVPVVLRALNFAAVALAALLTLSPLLCAGILYFLPRLIRAGQVHPLVASAIGLAVSLWALAAIPVAYAAILVPIAIYITANAWRPAPPNPERRNSQNGAADHTLSPSTIKKSLTGTFAVCTVFLGYIYPNAAASWLPIEAIETEQAPTFIAFVLESGDHDLTAVPLGPDDPIIIRQDDITKRTLCRLAIRSWKQQAITMPLLRFAERPMRGRTMPTCTELAPAQK